MEKRLEEMVTVFDLRYPDPETALNYNTPFELLIATILSAQTTDLQVNKVTEKLFADYNKPADFCKMERGELEKYIRSIGLYRNKSKYIIETSCKIMKECSGQVPANREKLMELPGVGRKTANVILACAFSKKAFPVDTHVFRVANRIGLVDADTVEQTEKQLMGQVPEHLWYRMHHWLIFFGREVCKARNPRCEKCPLNNVCKYHQEGLNYE